MDETPGNQGQDSGDGRWARLVAAMQPRWLTGDVTPIYNGHTTNWRTVAGSVVAFTGGGAVEVQFSDRPPQRVGPDEALCIPDGVLHRIDPVTPKAVSAWCHLELALPIAVDLTLLHRPPLTYTDSHRLHRQWQSLHPTWRFLQTPWQSPWTWLFRRPGPVWSRSCPRRPSTSRPSAAR